MTALGACSPDCPARPLGHDCMYSGFDGGACIVWSCPSGGGEAGTGICYVGAQCTTSADCTCGLGCVAKHCG